MHPSLPQPSPPPHCGAGAKGPGAQGGERRKVPMRAGGESEKGRFSSFRTGGRGQFVHGEGGGGSECTKLEHGTKGRSRKMSVFFWRAQKFTHLSLFSAPVS